MSEQIAFTFALAGTQKDEVFQVLTFTGDEGVSRLYEFNIELLSDNPDADIDAILQQPATLTLTQGDDVRVIQGIVSHFDAVRQINNQVLYKARLVPRLWELSLYHTNEVYLEMTVPEIIEAVLTEGGFESVDYDLSDLQSDYKKWAYKCQYGETHLDFISRLMERDGIYYYFTRGEVGEKVVFCDQLTMQESLPNAVVQYSAASSLEINALPNTVHSFVSQQKRLPYRVMLKDYNDDKPSVDVKGEAIIDDSANKSSEIYVWGQNIETPEEGEQLAQIRAEQIRAGKKLFHGESSVNRLIPGYFFTLQGHFRGACNQDYCLLGLHHEGTDRRLIDGGNSSQAPAYRNELSAQPADVQYRPALETPRPEINGVLNAYVDSEGDGHYAEIDEEGRYRILLPFDRVDRDGGKASHWIRMSQPFAGENQGMHFPLRKGTEVLLTFVGGDPDRPVIAGSMPNAGAPSVINAENHTNSLIQTKAGNRIELEDKDGKNRIKFETPQNGTYMHLGAPNHAGDGWVVVTDGIERKAISGGQQYTVVTNNTTDKDNSRVDFGISGKTGMESTNTKASPTGTVNDDPVNLFPFTTRIDDLPNMDALSATDISKLNELGKLKTISSSSGAGNSGTTTQNGETTTWATGPSLSARTLLSYEDEISGDYIVSRKKGVRYVWEDGIEFNYGQGFVYTFGNSHEVTVWNRQDTGAGAKLVQDMFSRNVQGLKEFGGNPATTNWKEMISKGEFVVKQTDTFTAQNGNIYDFGGYWNYNLGNSYEENHIEQNTSINRSDLKEDKASPGGPDWTSLTGKDIGSMTAGKTWVTKSIGNTYEYQLGDTLEVVVGDIEIQHYGKSYGYFESYFKEEFRGRSESYFYGAASEIFIGASNDLRVGAASEMKLIGGNNVNLGVWTDINIGLALNISKGWTITFDTAGELRKSVMTMDKVETKLKKISAELANSDMKIRSAKAKIDDFKSQIENGKALVGKYKFKVEKDGIVAINAKLMNVS